MLGLSYSGRNSTCKVENLIALCACAKNGNAVTPMINRMTNHLRMLTSELNTVYLTMQVGSNACESYERFVKNLLSRSHGLYQPPAGIVAGRWDVMLFSQAHDRATDRVDLCRREALNILQHG
jgi:hypothetical protein